MKFSLTTTTENLSFGLRRLGYRLEREERGELAFAKIIGPSSSGYPRFHLYVKTHQSGGRIFFNLHLDQKKPIYKGATAHSGEYEGALVANEAKRIQEGLQ